MIIDYISNFERVEELCDVFKARIEKYFFEEGNLEESNTLNYCQGKLYYIHFQPIKGCFQLCDILKPTRLIKHMATLSEQIYALEVPKRMGKLKEFQETLKYVRTILALAPVEIKGFSSFFSREEKDRINESIHNYLEGCFYSCVAMSVSAVESRLLDLMCIVSPDSKNALEERTLGQLIYEYLNNKDKYKNVVPRKHEHLLQLFNVYRTFSVHPMKEIIKPTVAVSILNLSIEFLIDEETKSEVIKTRFTNSAESK